MRFARLGICLAVATGCNGLLALEEPVADRDLDGVVDREDNCPDEPNPQQLDGDADGVGNVCDCHGSGVEVDVDGDGIDDACDDCVGVAGGVDSGGDGIDDGCQVCRTATGLDADADGLDDGCDPCANGLAHDEDGDGIFDACDNCPAQPNPDQAVTGPRAIGDACYVLGTRAFFDPFVVQDITVLPGNVSGWSWEDDALVTSGDATLTRSLRIPVDTELVFETRVTSLGTATIAARGQLGEISCSYTPPLPGTDAGIVSISTPIVGDLDTTIAAPDDGRIRFQLQISPGTSSCVVLDAMGNTLGTITKDFYTPPQTLQLESSGASRFEYIWITTR